MLDGFAMNDEDLVVADTSLNKIEPSKSVNIELMVMTRGHAPAPLDRRPEVVGAEHLTIEARDWSSDARN